MPDAGAGRRVPAAVRAAAGPRPRRARDDRRDGRPGGLHRGQVPDARQADAGAGRDPARSRPSSRKPSGGAPAGCSARTGADDAETIVVALGSVLGTIEDVVDELRERGARIGVVGIKCFRPCPLEEVRAALQGARRIVVAREGLRRRRRRDRRPGRAPCAVGASARSTTSSPGSGGRPITKRSLHALLATPRRPARARPAHVPRHGLGAGRAGARARRAEAPFGAARREHPARRRRRRRRAALRRHERAAAADQVLPSRELRRRATACSTPTSARSSRARSARTP